MNTKPWNFLLITFIASAIGIIMFTFGMWLDARNNSNLLLLESTYLSDSIKFHNDYSAYRKEFEEYEITIKRIESLVKKEGPDETYERIRFQFLDSQDRATVKILKLSYIHNKIKNEIAKWKEKTEIYFFINLAISFIGLIILVFTLIIPVYYVHLHNP